MSFFPGQGQQHGYPPQQQPYYGAPPPQQSYGPPQPGNYGPPQGYPYDMKPLSQERWTDGDTAHKVTLLKVTHHKEDRHSSQDMVVMAHRNSLHGR